jgi:hypothetical protein
VVLAGRHVVQLPALQPSCIMKLGRGISDNKTNHRNLYKFTTQA